MWTITKGSLASKNMPNICVLHALSIRASFDVTSSNNFDAQKVQEDEIFKRQDVTFFSQKDPKITIMQNPQSLYKHFKFYNILFT